MFDKTLIVYNEFKFGGEIDIVYKKEA